MKRTSDATERIEIPVATADMIRRRCEGLLKACMYEPNVLDALMLSCYQQGMMDAMQVIEQKPMFLSEYFGLDEHGYGAGI